MIQLRNQIEGHYREVYTKDFMRKKVSMWWSESFKLFYLKKIPNCICCWTICVSYFVLVSLDLKRKHEKGISASNVQETESGLVRWTWFLFICHYHSLLLG
jgi:hypothetical protein